MITRTDIDNSVKTLNQNDKTLSIKRVKHNRSKLKLFLLKMLYKIVMVSPIILNKDYMVFLIDTHINKIQDKNKFKIAKNRFGYEGTNNTTTNKSNRQ